MYYQSRARIFKLLRNPRIYSKELFPPLAFTITLFVVPTRQATYCRLESIPGLLKRLQIRALVYFTLFLTMGGGGVLD
jgi:hypothetical protein